jgi:S-adenosylmethionine decarboxylase
MTKLTLPYVVKATANQGKDPGGWSGFVIIQESHVSIHTFPDRAFATIDVYSCRSFDINIATDYFKKILNPDNMEIRVEERGKNYPLENQ